MEAMIAKGHRLAVLFAIVGAMVFAHSFFVPITYAVTLYVGTEPGDYPTIQAALDAASTGDHVLIRTGTYTEDIVIDKPGIQLSPDFRAEVLFDGNITLTAAAGGANFLGLALSEGTKIQVEDGIEWPVSLPEGSQNYVFAFSGSNGPLDVSLGNVTAHTDFASIGGVYIGARDHAAIYHTGTIDVETSAAASAAQGVSISTGDLADVSLGAVHVTADSLAIGTHFFTGNSGRLTLNGGLFAHARGVNSVASGLGIRGETDVAVELRDGHIEGGRVATGIDFNVGEGSVLTQEGFVQVTARDDGSEAFGVMVGAGNGSSLNLGSVSVEGGALARGVTTTYSPDIVVVTDGLKDNVAVNVGSVHVVSRDNGSDAYGIDLSGEGNITLTAGNVQVEGSRLVRAAWLRITGDGGKVELTGDVAATAAAGSAQGLRVEADDNFYGSVGNVVVKGASNAVQGVALSVGDGGQLVQEGQIAVTGTAATAIARGINVIAGEKFSASIGNVIVDAPTSALGLYWQSTDGGSLTHTGTLRATTNAGGMAGGATVIAGDGLYMALDTVEATAENGNASATGVFLQAGNDLSTRFQSVTAQGTASATGLWGIMQDRASLQSAAITARTLGDDAMAQGTYLEAGSKAYLAFGTVHAESTGSDSSAVGLLGTVGDDLVATLAHVTTAAEKTAWGVSLQAGERATVQLERVEAAAHEAYGVQISGKDLVGVSLGEVVAQADQAVWAVTVQSDEALSLDVDVVTAEAGTFAYGAIVQGGSSTVTVHGQITAAVNTASGLARGLVVGSTTADVTNLGRVHAEGNNAIGIDLGGASGAERVTFHNVGTVEASSDTGAAVVLNVIDSATVQNDGLIAARDGLAFYGGHSTGSITLDNAGSIVGDVQLGQGADVLTVSSTGTVLGGIHMGAGDDIATLHYDAVVAGLLDGGQVTTDSFCSVKLPVDYRRDPHGTG